MGCHAPEPNDFDNHAPSSSPVPGTNNQNKQIEQATGKSSSAFTGYFSNYSCISASSTSGGDDLNAPSADNTNQLQSGPLVLHSQNNAIAGSSDANLADMGMYKFENIALQKLIGFIKIPFQ